LVLQTRHAREHAGHAQRGVIGRGWTLQEPQLGLRDFRNGPGFLGGDAQVGRITVERTLDRGESAASVSAGQRMISIPHALNLAGAASSATTSVPGRRGYFNRASCTVSEPSTVRIFARPTSDWLAFSTDPSTWALTESSLAPRPSRA